MSRRKCKFNNELEAKYPMFKRTKIDFEVTCESCNKIVSISNKGKADLEQHLQSTKHKSNIQSTSTSKNLNAYFVQRNSKIEDKILAAEATMAFHTVKHHQSYKSCDCSTKLYRRIFSDSEVAIKYSSARTKTEAIVNMVLAPQSLENTFQKVRDGTIKYVGVCADGSNHGSIKMFPILVQYFSKESGITHCLLDFKSVTDEKSETICNLIINTLEYSNLISKCIAFTGDNCNTNFGGVDRRGTNNIFRRLETYLKKPLIGIGCPVHLLNNCVHHALDGLTIDVESIVLKIYNFFSIYTVRTEALKEFCTFVEIEYRKLLFHSKTRWLSLFPVINRVLQMFPALQSFFLSEDQPPIGLKTFFENSLNESYLWFAHSLMSIFHSRMEAMERDKNSLLEISLILSEVEKILIERKTNQFLPLKVKEIIRNNDENPRSATIKFEFLNVYERGISYLNKWTSTFEQFKIFEWMRLNVEPSWNSIEESVQYLKENGVQIDECLLFDQSINLKIFVKDMANNTEFSEMLLDEKWINYFKCRTDSTTSEFLKICSFFFAIPAHNAVEERVFSMMNAKWTNERNRLLPESVKNLVMVQFNYKDLKCDKFYDFCLHNKALLAAVRSNEKYKPIV